MITYNKRTIERIRVAARQLARAQRIIESLPVVDNELLTELVRLADADMYRAGGWIAELVYYAEHPSAQELDD